MILRCGLLRLCMMAGCPPDQGADFSRPFPFSSSEKTESTSDGSATGSESSSFFMVVQSSCEAGCKTDVWNIVFLVDQAGLNLKTADLRQAFDMHNLKQPDVIIFQSALEWRTLLCCHCFVRITLIFSQILPVLLFYLLVFNLVPFQIITGVLRERLHPWSSLQRLKPEFWFARFVFEGSPWLTEVSCTSAKGHRESFPWVLVSPFKSCSQEVQFSTLFLYLITVI